MDLGDLGPGRTLIYIFPMAGSPAVDMPQAWDAILGARGCSHENCDIRDHYVDLVQNEVDRVFGLSSQSAEYQGALVEALRLPYPLLTDEAMELSFLLSLPQIHAGDLTLYQRISLGL